MSFNFNEAFIGEFFTAAERAGMNKAPKKTTSSKKGTNAEVVQDELTPLLHQMQYVVGGGSGGSSEGRKKLLKAVQIQTAADNIRLFTNEQYADGGGNVKNWDKFKERTLYREGKNSRKIWNRRPSGARYSANSKLIQDTGAIRNSIGSIQGKGYSKRLAKTTKLYTEYGTAVSYAGKQNEMRTLLGISNTTWKKIYNIIYRGMGVSKR